MKTKKLLLSVISVTVLTNQSIIADPPLLRGNFQARVLEKGVNIAPNNNPNVLAVENIGGIIPSSPRFTEVKTLSYKEKPVSSTPVPGMKDGPLAQSLFNTPYGLCVDAEGNLIVVETTNSNRIRKIDFTTETVSFIAGDPGAGTDDDFIGASGLVDAKGTAARFFNPADAACDADGNIYVADRGNCCIRKIDKDGNVTKFAGTGENETVNGPRLEAKFQNPSGIAIDHLGNMYVTERSTHVIRKIDKDGNVTTFAGTVGVAGYLDGTGTEIGLNCPQAIVVDPKGNVYVAEAKGNRVRKITPEGVSSTIAGDNTQVAGTAICTDGQGTSAKFNEPNGLALDEYGYLYTSDFAGRQIRRISPSGYVKTLAGRGGTSFVDNAGGLNSFFRGNNGIAYSKKHRRLYVADTGSNAIRFVSLTGYFSENLPAGMSMHMGAGLVYGTPTTLMPKKDVIWEGYNVDGACFLPLPITVLNEGDLYYAVRSFVNGDIGEDGLVIKNGYISPSWEGPGGENVSFDIVPNEGYEIKELLINDEAITPVSKYTFTNVDKYNEIKVSFKELGSGVQKETQAQFSVYPTMVQENNITLTFDSDISNYVCIYDIMGKLMYAKEFNNEMNVGVDLSDFASGIYQVEVKGKGVIRIIKQ